jgi:hypothetical protein
MPPKTTIAEAALSAGQNEGIERALLPLPQLSYVQNARLRKTGRWGKRFGTAILSAVTRGTGQPIGNGAGNVRSVGPGFCTVDDQCLTYDVPSDAWIEPTALAPVNASTDPVLQNPRVPGVVSGWLPDKAFFPVPPAAYQLQTKTPCAQAFALGYLWSAVTTIDPLNDPDVMIRVVATDPTTQTVVFLKDIRASVAGQGGVTYPRLVVSGSVLILAYASRLLNAARSVGARRLTSLTGGFGAESTVAALANSSGIFDVSPLDASTVIACALTGANVVTVAIFTSALGVLATNTYTDALTTIESATIVGIAGGVSYLTITATGGGTVTRVVVFSAAFASIVGTANVSVTLDSAAYSVLLPGGGVRCIFGYVTGGTLSLAAFRWVDVSATATIAPSFRVTQYRFQPISRPFVVGTQVYLWCTNAEVTGAFGYATLLRIPAYSEFSGSFPTALPSPEVSCPIEASLQDFLVRTPPPNIDPFGLPAPTKIGTSATYAFMYPALVTIPDINIAPFSHDFRVVQFTHNSDSAAMRSVNAITTDSASFLAGSVFTRVDQRGAVEEGFAQTPLMIGTGAAAAGNLTPNSTYLYAAVYKSRNANGRYEVSGVSRILKMVLGAGVNQVSVWFPPYTVGARKNVQIEIYRTASNGSIFYYVTSIDGGISPISNGLIGPYVDALSDSFISSHAVLYTQVGQTLPNAFPPPCRFACVGGQRIWLGGLLRGDVIHASKSILGDQSPSWADNDAFRVVLPATCTGIAWLDTLVAFTAEGIYVVSGDGPDDSGQGAFSPPVRLPFALGCIEPRSVFATEEGVFFQTARGLYLLQRGFGSVVPAGDVVIDTLATYPIITGVVSVTKAKEQTLRWTCVNGATATAGATIVYDLAHKVWSVDLHSDPVTGSTTVPHTALGQWVDGEAFMAQPITSFRVPFKRSSSTFDDAGALYTMSLRTGDVRLFGNMSHGVVERFVLLTELRAACTLNVTKTTDSGTSPVASRLFTGVGPDYVPGNVVYTSASLGSTELRDLTALRLQFDETSNGEGLAFIALALEHGESQGFRLVKPADWVT